MNLKKIFQMQEKLDQKICQEHKVKNYQIIEERILALIVEVSEFANELSSFKYWKKQKSVNRDQLMEEFVDGIHFYTSLSLQLKMQPCIEAKITSENLNEQLLNIFVSIANLKNKFDKHSLQESFALYLGLANLCQISEKEIEDFYITKNKINYQRIANNY